MSKESSAPPARFREAVRIAVVGADAAAAYMALRLARSGVKTTLVVQGEDVHLAAMQRHGVRALAEKEELIASPDILTDDPAEAGLQDYVIVTEQDRRGAQTAETTKPLLGPGTSVVTAQTGVPWWWFYRLGRQFDGQRLESVDPGGALWDAIGPERALGCTIRMVAEIKEPGVVRHLSGEGLALGEPSGETTKRLEALSGILTDAGLKASIVDSIRDEIWEGIWCKAAFDPIGVLTCAPSAKKIADDSAARAVATAMMAEAKQVGEAFGVRFGANLEKRLDQHASKTPVEASMLDDLEAGRDLRIDALCTPVQEMARTAGVGTPIMDAVLALARLRAEVARPGEPRVSAGMLSKVLVPVTGGLQIATATVAETASAVGSAVGEAVEWAYDKAVPISRHTAESASRAAKWIHDTGQGILTTSLADDLNKMLANLVKSAPTIYDKAMDAAYNETGIGGGLHRLFDGSHTLLGAYKAARNAQGDDGIVARAMGMTLGLFRDVTTPAGLPFFTWDQDTYHKVADALKTNFGLPKKYFADLTSYNAADIASSLLSGTVFVFRWSKADAGDFARIFASTGLAASVNLNPLLLVVSLVALAKAFTEARKAGDYKACAKEFAEGAVATATPMAAVSLITAAGGPASIALVASIISGMAVAKLAKKAGEEKYLDALATRIASLLKASGDEVRERLGEAKIS